MEPISLIIAALLAGAAKAAGDSTAEIILEEHETDPETYEAPLKKKLAEAGADKDEAIITAAQELLKQLKHQESVSGKYNIAFQGEVKGIVIGDGNTQTNTFGS